MHPHDCPLLAVRLEGQIFIDTRLPFGLRSATKIFNAIAAALQWRLLQVGIPLIIHYLDDYRPPTHIAMRQLTRYPGLGMRHPRNSHESLISGKAPQPAYLYWA